MSSSVRRGAIRETAAARKTRCSFNGAPGVLGRLRRDRVATTALSLRDSIFYFYFPAQTVFLILPRRPPPVHFSHRVRRWSGRFVRQRASGTSRYPRSEPAPNPPVI